MKLVYIHHEEDIEVITEIVANHSISVEDALELAGIDMNEYANSMGWNGYDYNALAIQT